MSLKAEGSGHLAETAKPLSVNTESANRGCVADLVRGDYDDPEGIYTGAY